MSEIDVSKCKYYNFNEEGYDRHIGGCEAGACEISVVNDWSGKFSHYVCCSCSDNYNCYYKQLQQAKQDIEKAKKYNYDAGQQLIRMSQELQQLEQENWELKQKLERLLCSDNCYRLQPYKQCLDEIEEIINNFANKDIITLPDLPKEKNYKLIAEQYAEPIKQILQKIKEVKGSE